MKLTGESRTCIKQALQVSCLEQYLEKLDFLDILVLCGYDFDRIEKFFGAVWIRLTGPKGTICYLLLGDHLYAVPGRRITSRNIIKELNRAEKRKRKVAKKQNGAQG